MGRLLSMNEVEELTGVSKVTIYRRMKADTFPRPVKVGTRAVRWDADEIEQWKSELPRG